MEPMKETTPQIPPQAIAEEAKALQPTLSAIRREFHRHPELGTRETGTAQRILGYLTEWGIPYEYPVADTGIVAIVQGRNPEGRVVALRADMDALPLDEPEGRPYRSLNPGVMHACGHDAHMAILLGTAYLLKRHEDAWDGQVKLFFQPAEETVGGAARMIDAGCMEGPKVDFVAGLHVAASLPTGHIELRHGQANASSDELTILVRGRACHGAYPDEGADAIVAAAHLVTSLQSLVSRNISPLDSAVLTFGQIHGGTAGNIVSDQVELTGILRTLNPRTRAFAKQRIEEQTLLICQAMGTEGTVQFCPSYTALINDDWAADLLAGVAAPLLGKDRVHWKEHPSMGVEDFSFFLEQAPGVYYNLGCRNEEKGITAPAHNREFDIDEDCLRVGVLLQWSLTQALLRAAYPGKDRADG